MALLVLPKGWLCVGAKPNVPLVRLAENFKIFCAVGKKLKHRRVGKECRLTRCPNVVSFLCRWSPVKMVYFFLVYSRLFVVARSSLHLLVTFGRFAQGRPTNLIKIKNIRPALRNTGCYKPLILQEDFTIYIYLSL